MAMWRAPQQQGAHDTEVLTFSPKSKAALRHEHEKNQRRKKEQQRKEKLRKMAAAGLLPTQIDSKEGVVLGYAFKTEKERQLQARAAKRLALRQAKASRSMISRTATPPPASTAAPSSRWRKQQAAAGKPWAQALSGARQRDLDSSVVNAGEIRRIENRNERIKTALRARARARSSGPPPPRRRPASVPMLRSNSDDKPFPAPGGYSIGMISDSDSDLDEAAEPLPSLSPRAATTSDAQRPSTAPELNGSSSCLSQHPAMHFFNNLYEIETSMLSGGEDSGRPTTPYLDSLTAEESAMPQWGGSNGFHLGSELVGSFDPETPGPASGGAESTVGGSGAHASLFKLAGAGVNDLMISGIAAQIGSAKAMDEQTLRVDLSNNSITERGVEALADAILNNPDITDVDLANNAIKSKGGAALSKALEDGQLSRLSLAGNPISNRGFTDMCPGLRAAHKLRYLDLSRCEIGAAGGRALADAMDYLSGLVELNLAWNSLGTAGGGQFRTSTGEVEQTDGLAIALGRHREVAYVNLAWNSLGDEQVGRFAAAILENKRESKLCHVDLTSNNLTRTSAATLATVLEEVPSLKVLVLNKNSDIGFAGCRPILNLLQAGKIQEVALTAAQQPPEFDPSAVLKKVVVYVSHCGVDNVSAAKDEQVAAKVISDGDKGGEPSVVPAELGNSASAAEQNDVAEVLAGVLAAGLPGWVAGELPPSWRKGIPPAATAEHESALFAAKRAHREAEKKAVREAEMAAVAAVEAAEAEEAEHNAMREQAEADAAERAAEKEWEDVERARAELSEAERRLAAAKDADDMDAITEAQELVLFAREQLNVEEAEAMAATVAAERERQESDAAMLVARKERAEADAARAQMLQLEGESLEDAAKAAMRRQSPINISGRSGRADPRTAKQSAVQARKLYGDTGPPRRAPPKVFGQNPNSVNNIFLRGVRRQVVRNTTLPVGLMAQCKSLQLPLRTSNALGYGGVIGSISSDPLDPRITHKTKGLSFAHPSLTRGGPARRPNGLAMHELYDSTAVDVSRRRDYGTLLTRRHERAVDRAVARHGQAA